MAKSDSILDLNGTYQQITFVKSRTYGKHIRARRGTHKKAEVNASLKESSGKLIGANVAAKIVNDAISEHRAGLKGGQFWQALVSVFKRQLEKNGSIDFAKVPTLEIHKRYKLERFITVDTKISVGPITHSLVVGISYPVHPDFSQSCISGYRLGAIGIFTNVKENKASSAAAYSSIISPDAPVSPLEFRIPVPEGSSDYIVCVKIQGCDKHCVVDVATTQGMKIVRAGKIVVE
jgi:hypothetical protein